LDHSGINFAPCSFISLPIETFSQNGVAGKDGASGPPGTPGKDGEVSCSLDIDSFVDAVCLTKGVLTLQRVHSFFVD
jgi:hypothetical protein